MVRAISFSRRMSRLIRWCYAAAVVACLSLSGCSTLDLGAEQFHRDPMLEWSRQVRPPDNQSDFFGVSNKAREIERHLSHPGQ